MESNDVDAQNAEFWNEPCGVIFAGNKGFDIGTTKGLNDFDIAYFDLYPYLKKYLDAVITPGNSVIEVGLGLGTVSRYLASQSSNYLGVDVAQGPCKFVEQSLKERALSGATICMSILSGSMLDYEDQFDAAIAIGSLHHTGNLSLAVSQLENCVSPGGLILIMIYNEFDLRRLLSKPFRSMKRMNEYLSKSKNFWEEDDAVLRGANDVNLAGDPAPSTAYATKQFFKSREQYGWRYSVRRENFHRIPLLGRAPITRRLLLGWPAHLFGCDLYAVGVRK